MKTSKDDLFAADRTALATWVKLPATEVIELLALAGFDFVVIDMEHAPFGMETVSRMIATARAVGLPPIVRVPDHGMATMQHVLDAGAAGVFVPRVDTAAQARSVVAACRLPPDGTRGFGSTGRAGGWGLTPTEDYVQRANHQILVVAQLESQEALRNAGEISAVTGLDAVLIGPADLAMSMREEFGSESVQRAIIEVELALKHRKALMGTAVGGDSTAARRLADRGYRFLVIGNDAGLMAGAAKALLAEVRGRARGGPGQ